MNSSSEYSHLNLYKVLGVNQNSSQDEIKKAFRAKALFAHPDKGGSEEVFKQINYAYNILKDESKKAQYDENFEDDNTSPSEVFGFLSDNKFRLSNNFKKSFEEYVREFRENKIVNNTKEQFLDSLTQILAKYKESFKVCSNQYCEICGFNYKANHDELRKLEYSFAKKRL